MKSKVRENMLYLGHHQWTLLCVIVINNDVLEMIYPGVAK